MVNDIKNGARAMRKKNSTAKKDETPNIKEKYLFLNTRKSY